MGGSARALNPDFPAPFADSPACEEAYSDPPPALRSCSSTDDDTDLSEPAVRPLL